MRPKHTKSRLGCKECKARRVKCDESRPSCGKCLFLGRPCSFLQDVAILPPTSRSIVRNTDEYSRTASSALEPLPNTASERVSLKSTSLDPCLDERYGSLHLRLLYYFEHELTDQMRAAHPGMDGLSKVFITEAFNAPYLMDELLAYSAAHRARFSEQEHQFYRMEATRQQVKALTSYNNARLEVTKKTCIPMFLFSSLLCHLTLFDICMDSHGDFGMVLDRIVESVAMHRGLMAIGAAAWPMFEEPLQRQFLETCQRDGEVISRTSQGECDGLLALLDASDLSSSTIAVYRGAVEVLQELIDSHRSTGTIIVAVQDWLVRVPVEYIQCITLRRPEALAILAHYAILLHDCAENWFVGDSGKRLVHHVNRHLGPCWANWLDWPNRMIQYDR